jgi:hypothetical protein
MGNGVYPEKYGVHRLSKIFVDNVNRFGRSSETLLLLRYNLLKPWELLRMMPLAVRMILRGRVSFWPSRIKGIDSIRKILSAAEDLKLPRTEELTGYEEGVVGYGAVDSLGPQADN